MPKKVILKYVHLYSVNIIIITIHVRNDGVLKLQDRPTLNFSPEIIVNAGSSGRRLTESFSLMYSVPNEEAFSQLVNETSSKIHTEEPFDMSLVSSYVATELLKMFFGEIGIRHDYNYVVYISNGVTHAAAVYRMECMHEHPCNEKQKLRI